MKKFSKFTTFCVALLMLITASIVEARAQPEGTVSHVIMVWLKEPGNAKMREQFVDASRELNTLPGIISRHVGMAMPSDRSIVDDSFDVAVTVTLKDKAAFQAYMDNPKHKKIVEAKLKPLVDKIVAYDFISE